MQFCTEIALSHRAFFSKFVQCLSQKLIHTSFKNMNNLLELKRTHNQFHKHNMNN